MIPVTPDSVPPFAPLHGESAAIMQRLADRLELLTELAPPQRPVLYLDYPVHLNVGDSLIEAGTEFFLSGSATRLPDAAHISGE